MACSGDLQTSSLSAGGHSITAVYAGDAQLHDLEHFEHVSVSRSRKASTTVNVASPASIRRVVGQSIVFTAIARRRSPAPARPPARSPSTMARPAWALVP